MLRNLSHIQIPNGMKSLVTIGLYIAGLIPIYPRKATDEKQEIYFAWPKSATVSPVIHGTGKPQFHQTRRIHDKQSGKLVKSVAQITFPLTMPELSHLF